MKNALAYYNSGVLFAILKLWDWLQGLYQAGRLKTAVRSQSYDI
jgi:hypothetical protein